MKLGGITEVRSKVVNTYVQWAYAQVEEERGEKVISREGS